MLSQASVSHSVHKDLYMMSLLPGGSAYRRSAYRGGGLPPGGLPTEGGLSPGGLGRPPESEKRAVRILLEYFLVLYVNSIEMKSHRENDIICQHNLAVFFSLLQIFSWRTMFLCMYSVQ